MNPPGSSSLWPSSSRQGAAFELPQILYQPQPAAPHSSSSSYMNLLQMERPAGGIMISPYSKADARPEWTAGTAYKDVPGSRMGLDSGSPSCGIVNSTFWLNYNYNIKTRFLTVMCSFCVFQVCPSQKSVRICIGIKEVISGS